MGRSNGWIPKGDSKLLYEFLPGDHSRQTHSLREGLRVLDRVSTRKGTVTLLDLGCGDGSSYDSFSMQSRRIDWLGLDIAGSPEVTARTRTNLPFYTYDGVHIPLPDHSADIVYSRQVFEHVRHPEPLIAEVHRVLVSDGVFVGSTSHLEPFHSRSYWNYTPYGFCVLLRESGFASVVVRPGIDSLTLIGRSCLGYVRLSRLFEPFFKIESPMNALLEAGLRLVGVPAMRRNAFKLHLAGHFCFLAQK